MRDFQDKMLEAVLLAFSTRWFCKCLWDTLLVAVCTSLWAYLNMKRMMWFIKITLIWHDTLNFCLGDHDSFNLTNLAFVFSMIKTQENEFPPQIWEHWSLLMERRWNRLWNNSLQLNTKVDIMCKSRAGYLHTAWTIWFNDPYNGLLSLSLWNNASAKLSCWCTKWCHWISLWPQPSVIFIMIMTRLSLSQVYYFGSPI